MPRLALASILLASALSAPGGGGESAQAEPPAPPTTLARLRDVARPVLIFAPAASDPRAQEQLRTLAAHAAEARERRMVALVLTAVGAAGSEVTLTPADARAAREHFGVAPADFAVILVGMDGGEKSRARAPVPFERLQVLIDAMPMRQAEIRARRVNR